MVYKHYQELIEKMKVEAREQQEQIKNLKRNFASKFVKDNKNKNNIDNAQ